jgi:hypothetical protein
LKSKTEVVERTFEVINLMENQKGRTVKCIQSDNGTEYINNDFENLLKKRGITRRLTVPYNPEQNGISERKNRTVLDMARCLLIESGLPSSFWAEAVNTANYLRNRCPSKSLNGKTPYEMWTGKKPNLKHLRIFGSKVFCLNRSPGKGKLTCRSKEEILSSICDTLVISPAALTRHDVTRSNLSGGTSAQTCHDGEDTFFASGTNPA